MPRLNRQLWAEIDTVAANQSGLVTAEQFERIGLSREAVRRRCFPGSWWRVLPGIYCVRPAPLDGQQRRFAALLYAREDSALTGVSALQVHGFRTVQRRVDDPVHVLIPHRRRRASRDFVRIERTRIWAAPALAHGIPVAGMARVVADACRSIADASDVRAVVAEAIADGWCEPDMLRSELWLGQRRDTSAAKHALELAVAGAASSPEMALMEKWRASELPDAAWNVDLVTATGAFVARPDAFIADLGIVIEVDSREFHYQPDDWERTMRRDTRLTALGLCVLHITPRRIFEDWPGIVRDVMALIEVQKVRYVSDGSLTLRPEA